MLLQGNGSVAAGPEAMADLDITYKNTGALKPRARNPRTHSKAQIRQIADSITAFGFNNPVLIDGADEVIAGHGRLEAATLLEQKQVPTICLEDLSPEQVRAYVIADNRLAEKAGWDHELLALEFLDLSNLDLDFDIQAIGFETPEIDLVISDLAAARAKDDTEETLPEPGPGPAVSQPGDLWQIGPHRLICGDATDASTYDRLMAGEKAQMVFSDPPYNVPIDGHVSGLGQRSHREFAMAAGEMTPDAFTAFLRTSYEFSIANSVDGAIHFVCMDWRHIRETLSAADGVYSAYKNLCVWAKTNGGMGSLYRSQHELVFVFKAGTASHINNIELGRHGRNRTNLWTYSGVNGFGVDRDETLGMHPTVKPVALVQDAILDCSHRTGVVVDPFAGSGTTLVAAHNAGRRGYGIEIDPDYCDVILRRLAQASGTPAIHAESGLGFTEATAERISS